MLKINNFIEQSNINSYLKKYKSAIKYSFMVGLFMGSLPFIYKSLANFRFQKLIQEQRKIEMQNKEKICQGENSDYKKFLSLGFPKTAIEKFNICINEQ